MKINFFFKLLLVFIVLLTVDFILFKDLLNEFFSLDDAIYILKSNTNQISDFIIFLTKAQNPQTYRPLSTFVFFNFFERLFHSDPLKYHLVLFLLHATNATFVFLIANRLFNENFLSVITAIVYESRSAHTLSIGWIAGGAELIATFYSFLSFLFYINFRVRNQKFFFHLSLIFFGFSILSKETAVVLPFLFFVYEYFLDNFKIIWEKLSPLVYFLIVLICYFIIRYFATLNLPYQQQYAFSIRFIRNNLPYYILASFDVLSENFIDLISAPNLFIYLLVSILLLFLLKPHWKIKQKELILFGILWFFISMSPYMFIKKTYSLLLRYFLIRIFSFCLTNNF